MRRPLHCLLVAVLIFSLSVDTARACWHLRHAHRVHVVYGCPPAAAYHGGWSRAVVVADVAVGCGTILHPGIETVVSGHGHCGAEHFAEEIACGTVVECCAEPVAHVAPEVVVSEQFGMAAPSAPVVAAPAPSPASPTPALVAETFAPKPPAAAEPVRIPEPIEPVPAGAGDQSVVSVAEPLPVDPLPATEQAVKPASADTPVEPLLPEPVLPGPETNAERAPETAAADTAEPAIPEPRPEAPEPPLTEPSPQPADDVPNAPPAGVPEAATPEEPAVREAVKEKVAAPLAPEEPVEPNLFEEVEATPVPPATASEVFEPAPVETPSAAADETVPAPEPAADSADTAAATAAEPVQGGAAADEASEPAAAVDAPAVNDTPAADEPAANEAIEAPTPATESTTDPFSSAEPARRWIDATGRYAVVGTLQAVREATAEIRTADGRTVSVPLDRLSPHDRSYAEQAADRQLAGPATARPTDTAGL